MEYIEISEDKVSKTDITKTISYTLIIFTYAIYIMFIWVLSQTRKERGTLIKWDSYEL